MRTATVGLLVGTAGAVAGLALGYLRSPFSAEVQAGRLFMLWIEHPALYWHWPVLGFAVAGATFVAARAVMR